MGKTENLTATSAGPSTNHSSRFGLLRSVRSPSFRASKLPSRYLTHPDIRTMSWPDSLGYISFRQSTHPSYHRADIDTKDYTKLIAHAMKFVQEDLPTSALSASNDAKLLLELGIRY